MFCSSQHPRILMTSILLNITRFYIVMFICFPVWFYHIIHCFCLQGRYYVPSYVGLIIFLLFAKVIRESGIVAGVGWKVLLLMDLLHEGFIYILYLFLLPHATILHLYTRVAHLLYIFSKT